MDEFAISPWALGIPERVDIAVSPQRQPQAEGGPWPAGTRIVSADSHMIERDYWIEGFPEDLKDQAPRMRFHDGHVDFRLGDRPMTPGHIARLLCDSMECTPGPNDVGARLRDLDVEGVGSTSRRSTELVVELQWAVPFHSLPTTGHPQA